MGETMEYRFNAEEWAALSITDRIRRCVLLAAEARTLAAKAEVPALAEKYTLIAEGWDQLAREIGAHETKNEGRPLLRS